VVLTGRPLAADQGGLNSVGRQTRSCSSVSSSPLTTTA
jgi:hypothetical protein